MLTTNKYINRICWFLVVVWAVIILFLYFPKGCYAEDKPQTQQELTIGDKAKIAVGTCLFGLFWSDPLPDSKDESYMYPTDNPYTHDPIPNGVIKEKGD